MLDALLADQRAAVITIVVCDDHTIFRHGLRRLLETAPNHRIVGETSDRAQAVRIVAELEPDVLLLGVARPGGSALTTLRELKTIGASVRTILLSGSMDSDGVNDALKLGASAVVPKDASADVLFESIECVMAGQSCVGRERIADLSTSVRRFDLARRKRKAFGLTSRELKIVEAVVVSGDTNKAIAQRLGISENTVKRHLMHIYDKVGASNRVELAIFAAYHQLVDAV